MPPRPQRRGPARGFLSADAPAPVRPGAAAKGSQAKAELLAQSVPHSALEARHSAQSAPASAHGAPPLAGLTPYAPPSLSGAWRQRWFILAGSTLHYFVRDDLATLKEMIAEIATEVEARQPRGGRRRPSGRRRGALVSALKKMTARESERGFSLAPLPMLGRAA